MVCVQSQLWESEDGLVHGPSLSALLLRQVLRFWCAGEPCWGWAGAARRAAVLGRWGAISFFVGIGFYFCPLWDLHLILQPSPPTLFPSHRAKNWSDIKMWARDGEDSQRWGEKKEGKGMAKDADSEIQGREWDGGRTRWQHTDFSISTAQQQMSWPDFIW